LFAYYALQQQDGAFRYLRHRDFAGAEALRVALGDDWVARLDDGLARAVARGSLLAAPVELSGAQELLYFANTESGRAGINQLNAGAWQPGDSDKPVEILPERPNIYQLYEANIGPLTPLLAEALKDAADEFPPHWIEEAFREALAANARNWRYIRAILERWDREGRERGVTGQHPEGDGQKYISGKYAAFINYYRPDEE
jgi:DnaD/phage-associated family protein